MIQPTQLPNRLERCILFLQNGVLRHILSRVDKSIHKSKYGKYCWDNDEHPTEYVEER